VFFLGAALLAIVAFGALFSYRRSKTAPPGDSESAKATNSVISPQNQQGDPTPAIDGKRIGAATDQSAETPDARRSDAFEIIPEEPFRTQHNRPKRNFEVDTAMPRTAGVEVHSKPYTDSAVILSLSPTDSLALIDRNPRNGWYDVIDIKSGQEGWVAKEDVRIYLNNRPRQEPRILETYVGGNEAPTVVVLNDTDRELTLKVTEHSYKIAAGDRETLLISEGSASFQAWVPEAFPISGTKNWKRGYRYEWRFFISQRVL